MSKFVKFTGLYQIDKFVAKDNVIYLNADCVVRFSPVQDEHTVLVLTDGSTLTVKEPVTLVLDKL